MSDTPKGTIEFGKRNELDPAQAAEYTRKIAAAKEGVNALKGTTPVGHIPRPAMPVLTQQTGQMAELPSGLNDTGGVSPRPPGSPSIRPETQAQLAEFAEAQRKEAEKKVEAEVQKELVKADEDESVYDEFDLGKRNEADLVLANTKRRKDIESRCSVMSIDDLILKGEVHQTITIIPDKFEIEFRSPLPEESLFIKKIVAEGKAISDQHTLEYYGMLQLCCALVRVNGVRFPMHLDTNGMPDRAMFDSKYKKMMALSGYIINDLMVNLRWFDIRVRRLMNPEALGNG